jgi:gliding motility-associated-like protein
MKKLVLVLFLFLICSAGSRAQETWMRAIQDLYFGKDVKILPTPDRGWAVYAPDSFKLYKFNACGNLAWAKKYDLPKSDYSGLDFFTTTRRGGFAFLARNLEPNIAHSQLTLLDGSGNVLWSRRYSDPEYSQTPYSIGQDRAGNFMLYANVSRLGGGEVYNMIMKIRENGDHLWTRFYDHGGIWGGAIVTEDQGFLARTGSLLIKTDSLGQVQWSTMVYSGSSNYMTPLEVEDGYIVPGNSKVFSRIAYFKLNKSGNSAFTGSKSILYNGRPPFLQRTPEGNVAALFNKGSIGNWAGFPTAVLFNKDMDVIRSHSIKFANTMQQIQGMNLTFLTDGTPIATGTVNLGDFAALPQIFVARAKPDLTFSCDTTFEEQSNPDAGTTLSVPTSSFLHLFQGLAKTVRAADLETDLFFLCGGPPDPLQVEIEGDSLICSGVPVTLQKKSNDVFDTYLWSDGSAGTNLTVTQPGKYWVRATNSCRNETASDTFTVKEIAFPPIFWKTDTSLCETDSVLLNAFVPGAEYRWSDGSSLPQFKATQPGMYTVEIRKEGCLKSLTAHVSDCEILEMPTLFTPNGDGKNDRFVAKIIRGIPSATLEIYNRWGQKLFTTTDLKQAGWDGSGATEGVYFWVVRYRNFKGEEKVRSGVVIKEE